MTKLRVSYVLIGDYTYGWRDIDADRGVAVQRGQTVHPCPAADIKPGDLVRGITDSRIMTGGPVRIKNVRVIESTSKVTK